MAGDDEDVLAEDAYGRSARRFEEASSGCAGWIGGCLPLILLLVGSGALFVSATKGG